MKTIAMYLPQFHRVAENDKWWGEGFTEWTAVKAATPLFEGHKQPKIPLNNYYYNLLDKKTMMWQADLMKQYGVDGQCIYHYYFADGKKILEKPAENLLKWKDVDMPFCFCWANDSWARTWSISGGNSWADKFEKRNDKSIAASVLLEQKYGREEEWKKHYEYLRPFFHDKRYIKLEEAPVFLIFYPSNMSCLYQMTDYWRELSIADGFSGIYFIGANSISAQKGLDAVLMNAPHMFWDLNNVKGQKGIKRPEYQEVWDNIIAKPPLYGFKTYFGGVTNCDDSPRRERNGTIFSGFSVEAFKEGMVKLYRKNMSLNNEFVFINAWNEWGEGMYLEPDEENGYAYLEAVCDAQKMFLEAKEIKFKSSKNEDGEDENEIRKQLNHYQKTARCLHHFLTMKEEGKNIADYFDNINIKTIAVYGMGWLGKHLITELQGSDIEIKYIIDRRAELHHPQYDVKSPDDELQSVDAVVITPIWDFEIIYDDLKGKLKCRFFSIDEVISES